MAAARRKHATEGGSMKKPKKQRKIKSNSICKYCIKDGFCGKAPSLKCFVGKTIYTLTVEA